MHLFDHLESPYYLRIATILVLVLLRSCSMPVEPGGTRSEGRCAPVRGTDMAPKSIRMPPCALYTQHPTWAIR